METLQTQNPASAEPCNPSIKPSCGIASNIQKLMYILLSFALICILFLMQGGEKALMANSKARFPIANVDVDFIIFMILGPMILLLLMVYLHMFLGAWDRCNRSMRHEKLICIFYCCSGTTRLAFISIFFVMTPFVLCMFIYSARALPNMIHIIGSLMIICLIYLIYQIARLDLQLSWWIKTPLIGIFLGAVCVVIAVIWGPMPLYRIWPLKVSGADLSGANFSQQEYLRGAFGEKANFESSVFWRADLAGLYAPTANFQKANMTEANLTGADLGTANLTGAILNYARLIDAKLANTNFTRAALEGADFTSSKLGSPDDKTTTDSAIFFRSNLRNANLNRSFERCFFVEADLRNADFKDAHLSDAVFVGADLRGARNLTQEQLLQACGDKSTKIDDSRLAIPLCNDDKLKDVRQNFPLSQPQP